MAGPEVMSFSRTEKYSTSLAEELKQMRDDLDFTDFSIITKDASLPCHKLMIAAHSPVVKAMLKSGMKEVKKQSVNLDHIELGIMNILLDYMYAGEISFEIDLLRDLILACDYLQMKVLKEMCVQSVPSILTPSNVIPWLKLANDLELMEVKSRCKQIMASRFTDVYIQADFLAMLHFEVQDYFTEALQENTTNDDVMRAAMKWVQFDQCDRFGYLEGLLRQIHVEKCSLQAILDVMAEYETMIISSVKVYRLLMKATRGIKDENEEPEIPTEQANDLGVPKNTSKQVPHSTMSQAQEGTSMPCTATAKSNERKGISASTTKHSNQQHGKLYSTKSQTNLQLSIFHGTTEQTDDQDGISHNATTVENQARNQKYASLEELPRAADRQKISADQQFSEGPQDPTRTRVFERSSRAQTRQKIKSKEKRSKSRSRKALTRTQSTENVYKFPGAEKQTSQEAKDLKQDAEKPVSDKQGIGASFTTTHRKTTLLIIGGQVTERPANVCWALNEAQQFTPRGILPFDTLKPRHSICKVARGVVITGGEDCDLCWMYDGSTWVRLRQMLRKRFAHGSVCVEGLLLVVGGIIAGENSRSVDCLNLESGYWQVWPDVAISVRYPLLANINASVYLLDACGGKEFLRLDVVTKTWTPRSSLPVSGLIVGASMVVVGEKLYVAGGLQKILACYLPATDTWSLGKPTRDVHFYGSLVHYNNKLVLFGGKYNTHGTDEVEEYSTEEDEWSVSLLKMPASLSLHSVVILHN